MLNAIGKPEKLEIERVAKLTTTANVYQIVRTSGLRAEDQLAVVAFRQLSAEEIIHTLEKFKELIPIFSGGNGYQCGRSCGDNCGHDCGGRCGFTCDHSVTSTGVFCGSGCMVQPGSIGILDQAGQLNISMQKFDTQRFILAVQELNKLPR